MTSDRRLAVQFSEAIPSAMWMIRFEMRRLAKSKLTVPQFRILAHLSQGLASNNQLAEMQGVGVASMSRMVDGLVKRNLIRREVGKPDRRKVELRLSPKGKKEFESLRKAAQSAFAAKISLLAPTERKNLHHGLHVLSKLAVLGRRCSLFLLLTLPAALHAADLETCFKAALKRSETVAEQSELIVQAEDRVRQARSAVLPSVQGVASYTRHQSSGLTATGAEISPLSQPLLKITGIQPIFRGFREFAALRGTKELARAEAEARKQAVIQLYEDVADNFYSRLTYERELKNLSEQIDLYSTRAKELKQRVRIGRSRPNEVLTLDASMETLAAQMEQTQGQIRAARESFAFLTGLPADTPLEENLTPPPPAGPVETYLTDLDNRPDIREERVRSLAAKENTWVAKGAYLPSVDVTGNYYFYRTGVLSDVNWDVGVMLTMPLFEGGATRAKVHEALSQQKQSELIVSRVRRDAEREVRSRHALLESDLSQLKAFQRAKEMSEKSYVAERRDYQFGLVTNLDVLQALAAFQETKRALDRILFSAKLDHAKLESSVARRPAGLRGK